MHNWIENSPHGCVLLDDSYRIQYANKASRVDYVLPEGDDFIQHVHENDRGNCVAFLANPAAPQLSCNLQSHSGQRSILLTKADIDEGLQQVWLQDQTILSVLQEQLQQTQATNRKLIRDINHLSIKACGFGELVQIMLDDSQTWSDKAQTGKVARYHEQLMQYLQTVVRLSGNKPLNTSEDSKHLLIVDDEEIIVEFLTELIQLRGWEVTGFTDPSRALEAFVSSPVIYDLAIIDHPLPGFDGLAFAKQLHSASNKLPIMLCTNQEGISQPEFVREILTKPVDIDVLMSRVAEILDVDPWT